MAIERCCKTCRYWDADAARDKAGRIRSDRVSACLWEHEIIAPHWFWKHRVGNYVGKYERFTSASDGAKCNCWRFI